MSYRIYKHFPDGSSPKFIEEHNSPWAAQRAALILSAHELRHERFADFRVNPPTFLKADELNLPDWVKEVLDV